MADATGTGGDILGAAAPVLNAVPVVGSILSAAASIGSGLLKNKSAKDQLKRAQDERDKAANLPKAPIRKEYLQKLRMDQMAALSGIPGYNQAQNKLDESTANNLRNIRESSPDGASTLAAISASLGAKNASLNDLSAQNAAYQTNANKTVANDVAEIGDKQRELEVQQRADQAALRSQATNLENAGTANRIGSTDQILSNVGALGKLFTIDANGKKVPIANAATGAAQTGTGTTSPTLSDPNIAAIMAHVKQNSSNTDGYGFWKNNTFQSPSFSVQ